MSELFLVFVDSIATLLIGMAIGFFCYRKRIITDIHIPGLIDLLVRITMPATVFISLMRPFSRELLFENLTTLAIFTCLTFMSGILGGVLAKLMRASDAEREVWQFGSAFGNVTFMGIPVILVVFGPEGLIFVSMSMIASNILTFTYGIRMFKSAPKHLNIMKLLAENPVIPAAVLGFAMFLTGLRFPSTIENSVSLLAAITTPLSMIVFGAILARNNLIEAFLDIRLIPHSILKLVVLPIITLFVLRSIFGSTLMVHVLATLVAMPVAAKTVILAEKYAENSSIAARFVVVTTLLSAISVPLLSLLF